MAKADGEYKCPDCGKTFDTKAALDTHEESEHEDEEETAKRLATVTKRAEQAEAELKALKAKEQEGVAKALADAEEAREEVRKLREDREREQFIKRAEPYKVFMKADDLGPILRKISKALSPDEMKGFEQRLKAVATQLEKSALFDEVGHGSDSETASPEERLAAGAAEIRKREPKLSREQAMAEFLKTDEGKVIYADYDRAARSKEK